MKQPFGPEAKAALSALLLGDVASSSQADGIDLAADDAAGSSDHKRPPAWLQSRSKQRGGLADPQGGGERGGFVPTGAARAPASSFDGDLDVTAFIFDVDEYGRYIVDVVVRRGFQLNSTYVQEAMVKTGMAWSFQGFGARGKGTLVDMMDAAKAAKVGLWADGHPAPVAPWTFRRQQKESSAAGHSPARGASKLSRGKPLGV